MSFVLIMNTEILKDNSIFEENFAKLSKMRQEKITSFYFPKDKCLCLAAGILLDRGLAHYGLRENKVSFYYNPYGKAYISEFPQIHFNISHSGTFAVCAFSVYPVGIDIEKKEYMKGLLDLAYASLHYDEYTFLLQSQEGKHSNVFYSFWTAKESFSKSLGLGLALEARSYALPYPIQCYMWEEKEYYFKEYILDGYALSLCTQEQNFSQELEYIAF